MRRCCLWALATQVAVAGAAFAQSGGDQGDGTADRLGRQRPSTRAPAAESKPWTVYATALNGLASNVHFDREQLGSYGLVVAGGAQYAGDVFAVNYEIARHVYTNTSRWDRFSHRVEASYEPDLPGRWNLETIGIFGVKGSSEDRDLVDQDLSIMPRLDYRFTPGRRLRLFTRHRLKRYNDAPETNAVQHYIGAEFRESLGPGRYWRAGARFETNDERVDRGDHRRWTYFLEHAVPVTDRDTLVVQLRYRLRRYTHRFVEVEDEDVPRTDHQWIPSVEWVRAIDQRFDLRFTYTYESNYSNDPGREYGAHLAWSGVGVRW